VPVRGLHDLVRHELDLVENLIVPASHEALDREDGVLGVRDRLALGDLADENLPFLREADHGRRETMAFRVGDDDGVASLDDGHYRVGGAEIDADYLSHMRAVSLKFGLARWVARDTFLADFDLDLARLDLFRLREPDLEDAVEVIGADLLRLD